MARRDSAQLKGDTGSGAVIIIVIIVAVLVILFAFPGAIQLPGLGGGAAPIGVGPGTAGVVISSFQVIPNTIEAGDDATFLITVENRGGIDANDVDYTIFGLEDSNSWTGVSSVDDGDNELEHADNSRGIPGGITTQEWEAQSKEKNTDISYPVTARVDYDYSTEADIVLLLYGRDNPNVKNTGIQQSTISQVAVTDGPLRITTRNAPPLIGANTDDFRLSFDIVNIGGGRTYTSDRSDDLDRIQVDAEGCDITSSNNEFKLINGQRTISCKVNVNIEEDGQATQTIKLTVDYRYIVESRATATVLKQYDQ